MSNRTSRAEGLLTIKSCSAISGPVLVSSKNDMVVVGCSSDQTLRAIIISSAFELKPIAVDPSITSNIKLFGNDGDLIAATTGDGGLQLWKTREGKALGTVYLIRGPKTSMEDAFEWVFVAPSGQFDGTPAAMDAIGWRSDGIRVVEPLSAFYNDFYEPGLLSDSILGRIKPPCLDLANTLQIAGFHVMEDGGMAYKSKDKARQDVQR